MGDTKIAPNWLEQQYRYCPEARMEFTEGQRRCLAVIGSTDQLYNLPIIGRNDPAQNFGFKFLGDRLDVLYRGSMSTFDGPRLTHIVKAAHQHRVRVEFSPELVMLPIEEIDQPLIEPGCDHSEWGWGSCECTVWPCAVMRIGLNARQPDRDKLEGIRRTWAWHPGPERLTEGWGVSRA